MFLIIEFQQITVSRECFMDEIDFITTSKHLPAGAGRPVTMMVTRKGMV